MFARRIRRSIIFAKELKNLHPGNVKGFIIPRRNMSMSTLFESRAKMHFFFATITAVGATVVLGYYQFMYKPSDSNLPDESFSHVKIHPEIIKRIGEPMSIKKTISIKEGHSACRIKYLVSGPSGDATVIVDGTLMYRNRYSIDRLIVTIGADNYLLFQYNKKLYTSIVDISTAESNFHEVCEENLPKPNIEVDSTIIVNLKSNQSIPVENMNTSVQDMSSFFQPVIIFFVGIATGVILYYLSKWRKDVGLGRDIILDKALKEIITSDGINKILGVNIMANSGGHGKVEDLKAEVYQKIKGSLGRGKFEVKAEKREAKWVFTDITLHIKGSKKKYKIPFHDKPFT